MNTCFVIGNPIEHSLSPLIHNIAYKELNLEYNFLKEKLEDKDLKIKINSLKNNEKIKGISVTLPFKLKVIDFIDELSDDAKAIGAVNTIYKKNDKIVGSNTDWYGIYAPLKEKLKIKSNNALVVGAGGASRSAIFALKKLGFNIYLKSRNLEKVKKICDEFKINFYDKNLDLNFDVLINATPIGMYPKTDELSVSVDIIKKSELVFDLVYNPIKTKLLETALSLNKEIIYGTEMFLFQAVKQFEIYTSKEAPVKIMRETLLNKLNA